MDNKKNTILLTVIAVATLLVAVVGATFAYFTAQVGNDADVKVTVKTGSSASSSFTIDKAISLYADQTTFGSDKGSVSSEEVTGTVKYTAAGLPEGTTGTLDESDTTFCYKVQVVLAENVTNAFVYSQSSDKPELLLFVTKNNTAVKALVDDATISYKENVTDRANAKHNGFDITTVTNKTLTFPGNADGLAGVQKMTASAGTAATDDVWKLTVTLINYEADQNLNVGKSLEGNLKFTAVSCTDGTALKSAAS